MNNTECCSETKTLQHFCFYTAKAVQFRYKSKKNTSQKALYFYIKAMLFARKITPISI